MAMTREDHSHGVHRARMSPQRGHGQASGHAAIHSGLQDPHGHGQAVLVARSAACVERPRGHSFGSDLTARPRPRCPGCAKRGFIGGTDASLSHL